MTVQRVGARANAARATASHRQMAVIACDRPASRARPRLTGMLTARDPNAHALQRDASFAVVCSSGKRGGS